MWTAGYAMCCLSLCTGGHTDTHKCTQAQLYVLLYILYLTPIQLPCSAKHLHNALTKINSLHLWHMHLSCPLSFLSFFFSNFQRGHQRHNNHHSYSSRLFIPWMDSSHLNVKYMQPVLFTATGFLTFNRRKPVLPHPRVGQTAGHGNNSGIHDVFPWNQWNTIPCKIS